MIDLERNKCKLQIIENEFRRAEKILNTKEKEEVNARDTIRTIRLRDLESSQLSKHVQSTRRERVVTMQVGTNSF